MTIVLNGEAHETASATLAALLKEIALDEAVVATALNGEFIPADARREA